MSKDIDLTEDLWHLVFREFTGIWQLSPRTIEELQTLSLLFKTIFQPYIYRHVNLRTPWHAVAFFRTLATRADLAPEIRTLQLSFELCDCSNDFWQGFRGQLPRMTALENLSLAYSHLDDDCLHRLLETGKLGDLLPPSAKTLHLKPVYQDIYEGGRGFPDDRGPWCSTLWRLTLAQIPHFSHFIVTTPVYIVWPPTSPRLTTVFAEWTAQLRKTKHRASSLCTITLNSGFEDNGKRTREYRVEFGVNKAEDPELGGGDDVEGSLGTRLQWGSENGYTWKMAKPDSTVNVGSYFFGWEGRQWELSWGHLKPGAQVAFFSPWEPDSNGWDACWGRAGWSDRGLAGLNEDEVDNSVFMLSQ
ncbi:hypothetical protein C8J57DRAFT_1539486 [Mycena rebaudengoi]|nr:hypothetical protein C8J57DRAFT_1539486 [Mycena rebaudengoi]